MVDSAAIAPENLSPCRCKRIYLCTFILSGAGQLLTTVATVDRLRSALRTVTDAINASNDPVSTRNSRVDSIGVFLFFFYRD